MTDTLGAPLADAAITITGPVAREGVTAADGLLRVTNMRAGTYRLRFAREGSITLEAWVSPTKIGDGQQVYLIGKGRTGNKGFAKDNQNWSLRIAGSGGKLLITVHANASLFKAPEIKRAVESGQVQIGEVPAGAAPHLIANGRLADFRCALAPLTNLQSHPDGRLSEDEFRWLTFRAKGGFGMTMLMGGLNYQIEHHLFPSMPRPNLRHVQPMVRSQQPQCLAAAAGFDHVEAGALQDAGFRIAGGVGIVDVQDHGVGRCSLHDGLT